MLDISRYLKKFQFLTSKESEVARVLVEVISRRYGVDLLESSIKFNNKQIFVSAHPILKSKLYLDKKNLLAELNERLDWVVKDIR